MEIVARVFEAVGVGVIVLGGFYSLFHVVTARPGGDAYFDLAKRRFGRPLILGLEILVAADIIKTITVDLTLETVATLGILVLIRVVLSYSLEIETDGMAPWRRAEFSLRWGAEPQSVVDSTTASDRPGGSGA